MINTAGVKDNLLNLTNLKKYQLKNQVVSAFKGYKFNGETELILNYCNNNSINAYINHIDSPVFTINFVEKNDLYYCNSVAITYTNVNVSGFEE